METNSAVEQNENIRSFESRGISPVGKENVHEGKELPKSRVSSSERNTERVREYASGDSENGEDDELPRVIGEIFVTFIKQCCNILHYILDKPYEATKTA